MKAKVLSMTLMMATLMANADSLKLQLPPKIYAVPGIETNVYFDNIVLTVNPENYVFDVDCPKGYNDQERWRFTPRADDVGEYEWSIKIMDSSKVVATGKTKLVVSPTQAGNDKSVAILIVGDSLTDMDIYPEHLYSLCTKPGNPKLTMLGTNGHDDVPTPESANEGYGGWTWGVFVTKAQPTVVPANAEWRAVYRASPFFPHGKLDIPTYFKESCGGHIPDIITIQLGGNDIFYATDENLPEKTAEALKYADQLLAELRKAAPNAIIGIGLLPPGAASQDAFTRNYGCGPTRWQYQKNHHYMNDELLKTFASGPDPKISLIPTNINLDTVNNFPSCMEPLNARYPQMTRRQSNGLHPSPEGFRQIGDTYYCWLKYQLSQTSK